MIDIEKAIEEFIGYTNEFNLTDNRIKGKQQHSLRVMENSTIIAKSLNLSDEEIELATLIGLLHDIGRFRQLTEHNTFRDSNEFDHGDEGERILKNNNYIRKFIKDDKYDNIIFASVRNHNKFIIEDNLSDKELLFAKIVRDADKLDIIYETTYSFFKNNKNIEYEVIDDEVIRQFKNGKLVKYDAGHMKKVVNNIIIYLGYIYDLNFKGSFRIIKDQNYINKAIDRFKFKKQNTIDTLEDVRIIANKYVESRLQ